MKCVDKSKLCWIWILDFHFPWRAAGGVTVCRISLWVYGPAHWSMGHGLITNYSIGLWQFGNWHRPSLSKKTWPSPQSLSSQSSSPKRQARIQQNYQRMRYETRSRPISTHWSDQGPPELVGILGLKPSARLGTWGYPVRSLSLAK